MGSLKLKSNNLQLLKMELNLEDGKVRFTELLVHSKITVDEINNLRDNLGIQLGVQNAGFQTYRIPSLENDEYCASLIFSNGKLMRLSIGAGKKYHFPAFEITDEEINLIDHWLFSLGGEKIYSWGSVVKNIDPKGGNISISIKYNI